MAKMRTCGVSVEIGGIEHLAGQVEVVVDSDEVVGPCGCVSRRPALDIWCSHLLQPLFTANARSRGRHLCCMREVWEGLQTRVPDAQD